MIPEVKANSLKIKIKDSIRCTKNELAFSKKACKVPAFFTAAGAVFVAAYPIIETSNIVRASTILVVTAVCAAAPMKDLSKGISHYITTRRKLKTQKEELKSLETIVFETKRRYI